MINAPIDANQNLELMLAHLNKCNPANSFDRKYFDLKNQVTLHTYKQAGYSHADRQQA